MKFAKALTASAALGLMMLGNAGAAEAPRSFQPLFGEFVASNPGLEVAIPQIRLNNPNQFGYPETIAVNYKVYALGTRTLLLSTPAKLVTPPDISACTDLNQFHFDWNLGFSRRAAQLNNTATPVSDGVRLHTGVNMEVDCYTGDFVNNHSWMYKQIGGVYSANLSGDPANGGAWIKVFAGKELAGFNGVDSNGDLVNDKLTITTVQGKDGSEDMTVLVVNGTTGVVESTTTYALVRAIIPTPVP